MNLCGCDREERDHGVGSGRNTTMMSETLEVVRVEEVSGRPFWLRKKPMNKRDHGVGPGRNGTMMSETLEVVGVEEASGRPL